MNLDQIIGNIMVTHKSITINIINVLDENELVFIHFYAKWCHHCKMLLSMFDDVSYKIAKEIPIGKVIIANVDCDKEYTLAAKFRIKSYPTFKIIRNGQLDKRYYNVEDSTDGFISFIRKQLEDPVIEFLNTTNFKSDRNSIIGN